MRTSRIRVAAALLALLTAAAPLRAETDAPASPAEAQSELRDWMRAQAARLADAVEALRDRLLALGRDAGPAFDRAQQEVGAAKQRLDAEMPYVRETTVEMMERLKAAAAETGSALQSAAEELRRRLRHEDDDRPKELRT